MKIAIGGMIASGKSTLVNKIADHYNYHTAEEFDSNDHVFNTLLEWLYEGVEDVEMLLQVYFLHKHWKVSKVYNDDVVVDRHMIEHWLFAQHNIQEPVIRNFYNGIFHAYMNDVKQPDLYIILDLNWDSFKNRIFARGREQEIENFPSNEPYFKGLMDDYVNKLKAQCAIYNIPYIIIDTNVLDIDGVYEEAKRLIDKHI